MTLNPDDMAALDAERQRLADIAARTAQIEAQIRAGIAELDAAAAAALTDATAADQAATDAATSAANLRTRAGQVGAWNPTASVATDLASLKATVVADLRTLAAEHVRHHEDIATVADVIHVLQQWRAKVDRGVKLAYADLAYLGRLITGLLFDPPVQPTKVDQIPGGKL